MFTFGGSGLVLYVPVREWNLCYKISSLMQQQERMWCAPEAMLNEVNS